MTPKEFGQYRLVRLVAEGRCRVYEAEDSATHNRVAVKIFAPGACDDVTSTRVQREAGIVARLLEPIAEPRLVPVADIGEIDGRLYLQMPFIDAGDLQSLLAGTGSLAPRRAVAIVGQIAAALDTAHAAGLIHREVCPQKILVTDDDRAYLLGLPSTSGIYGDPSGRFIPPADFGYTAPERFLDKVTSSAATYSLACVLYECLTGMQPFPSDSVEEQIMAHLNKVPPKPSDANPCVPSAFDEVIARGMAKNPEDRYASAGELAEAARDALGLSAPQSADRTVQITTTKLPIGESPPTVKYGTAPHPRAPQDVTCDVCGAPVAADVGETRPLHRICGNCKREALPRELAQRVRRNPGSPLTIAGYTVLEELDRSGLGPVFSARQPNGELCALKVLPSTALTPDERTKVWPLAQVRGLHHRNIVALREISPIGEFFLVAVEYCPGDSLEGLVRRIGLLTIDQAVPLALQCLDALHYAHTIMRDDGLIGVAHGDIKPANILLTWSAGDPITKLADFGLATPAGEAEPVIPGRTPQELAFMPRPQVMEPTRAPTRDVDVWRLAACLYYMLTGWGPRHFPVRADTADVVINTAPMPIRRRNPKIPPRVAAVIDEALVDKPRIRIARAGDLAHALREATFSAHR